ncbi:hypothetical protein K0B03_02565 [Patescibacteria group bacterium]|nr:hypothetical protein [Patescibacteria group bacterium]
MGKEFEYLLDTVLNRGIKHFEIISAIQTMVLQEYTTRYPENPGGVEVIVNENTGDVRLMLSKTDITPADFSTIASQIALQVLIQKLKKSEDEISQHSQISPSSPAFQVPKESESDIYMGAINWVLSFLFWAYNGFYIVLISLYFLYSTFSKSYREEIGSLFLDGGLARRFTVLIILAVPCLSFYIAYKLQKTKKELQINKIIFQFELPLIIILIFSLFVLENAPLAVWFFINIIIFFIGIFFLDSLKIKTYSLRQKWVIFILKQAILISAVYLIFLYLFIIPILIKTSISYISVHFIFADIFAIFLRLILIILCGLLLAFPFLITYLIFKSFRYAQLDLAKEVSTEKLKRANIIIALAWIFLVFVFSYQPNSGLVQKLEDYKSLENFEQREDIARQIIEKKSKIEKELTEISKEKSSYNIDKNNDFLKNAYRKEFKFDNTLAGIIQKAFIELAYPFVYQGTYDRYGEALLNYKYIFGYEFGQEGKIINQSKKIQLVSRKIHAVTEHQGALATVSIEEEFKNTVTANQEVVYEFSLPANAVIMDLKLGADLEFDGVIAPRGAAGKVYQAQLVQRRDPAILEQTGPRQYRLRVFPIPSKNDRTTLGGKNQKVKFSYVTEITSKGYALPIYSKKQNINIDDSTEISYYLDAQSVATNGDSPYVFNSSFTNDNLCNLSTVLEVKEKPVDYMPLQLAGEAEIKPVDNILAQLIPYKNFTELNASYRCDKEFGINLMGALKNSKFAVLFDASYENKDNLFLDDFINNLKTEENLLKNNTIDFYLFNDMLSKKRTLVKDQLDNLSDVIYFGTSEWTSQIKEIENQYDFIIVFTLDSKVLTQKDNLSANNKAPLYIIHKDNIVPPYSAEVSNYIMQSGGKVALNLNEVISHYVLTKQLRFKNSASHIAFNPYWIVSVPNYAQSYFDPQKALDFFYVKTNESDPLLYFIDKAYLDKVLSSYQGSLENDLKLADSFHYFSQKNHIVSPYSSLLALVNKQQMQELKNASQDRDRYSYEIPDTRSTTLQQSGKIEGWGSKEAPQYIPKDNGPVAIRYVSWFIIVNVGIIILAIVVRLILRYRKKYLKKTRKR